MGRRDCANGGNPSCDRWKSAVGAMEKVKNFRAPMVLNAINAVTCLVVAQNKDCEITAIPELLKLLDIQGSTVTADAVGTQTQIMTEAMDDFNDDPYLREKNMSSTELTVYIDIKYV